MELAPVCSRLGVAGLLYGDVSSESSVTKQLKIASSCPEGRASEDWCTCKLHDSFILANLVPK